MDDYISKPVNIHQLAAKLSLWLPDSSESASWWMVPAVSEGGPSLIISIVPCPPIAAQNFTLHTDGSTTGIGCSVDCRLGKPWGVKAFVAKLAGQFIQDAISALSN